jgi:hypothetical protein
MIVSNEYKECKRILEKAYEDWIKHCRAKSLDPKVGILAKNAADKSDYFFASDVNMKEIKVQYIPLDNNDIKLSRSAKEMMKLEFIRRMENELNNCKPDDFTIPCLTTKVKNKFSLV